MKRIYVAGPYTKGDVAVNVKNAMEAGLDIIKAGHAPYVPHLSHFLHMQEPQPYGTWMAIDLAWIDACDYFLRLPGESEGADQELFHATFRDIPIFTDIKLLLRALSK